MNDGPTVNIWDALAVAAWVLAIGLVITDALVFAGDRRVLTPSALLIGMVASVLSVAGVIRRAQDAVLSQMHKVFQLGRESVREIRR